MDATIGRLYLREVDVAKFSTTLKLDGGQELLNPFQMTLNGAPVKATADLNLGVVGYQYDVMFDANRVPIAPLTDTFSPAYKGKAKGDLLANAQIKGAGITGTSLQKNLSGRASVVLTNADHESIYELYVGLGAPRVVSRPSVIAGSAQSRRDTTEALFVF